MVPSGKIMMGSGGTATMFGRLTSLLKDAVAYALATMGPLYVELANIGRDNQCQPGPTHLFYFMNGAIGQIMVLH